MAEPVPMPVPSIRSERVVIYCLNCGRSTTAAAFVIEGLFGFLPYGFLTGRLHCKNGCGDRFGVVLPIDAPTPRAFVDKYGRPEPPPPKAEQRIKATIDDLPGALVEIGDGGTMLRVHARAEEPEILHFGFDLLLKKFSVNGHKPPRLAVTRGAQWSRDSLRDYKVVAGKVIELHSDGPEKDEGKI